ncbi:MAG: hypothetical protein M1820_002783 [Bogoriella megaspora]|nr:MAG: hypothetical protein M1820_002783 [Bogoriella megaspora]
MFCFLNTPLWMLIDPETWELTVVHLLRALTSITMYIILAVVVLQALLSNAACPYMETDLKLERRQENGPTTSYGNDGFLDNFTVNDTDSYLTTDFGTPVDDRHSLKAGDRGPTLLEDFVLRTKITRFDHERIPERAVHARGAAAHGYFESYADWSNVTAASFLGQAGKQTPIFLRFSTVAGSRGSVDTARDIHGFALRFYTDAGNYDIVGNNVPVFFIQDAIQFPDLVHAFKPRQDNEIPQAATAHDSAWDFFSQNPSSLHAVFWALSGHGIPRSYRHVDGFGVHTFRFVNDNGDSKLVKFHFTSQQGVASLTWAEAQATAGQNADFHRADLFAAIESGNFPEWEMGVQIMDESDVLRYGYDLLDPTKIVPVEDVPITPIGKLVLNQNVRNYFAETEQAMFSPGHVVRGIDFSDDPLLQGRLFSYVDTQLNRNLGSPNFEQIPINRPRVPVHNNNRDGAGQQMIPLNLAAYSTNSMNNGSPYLANQTQGGGFFSSPQRTIVNAQYVRELSPTFLDYWSQPRLFYNSLGKAEQQQLVNAARFELSNLQSQTVQSNVIAQFNKVDHDLAVRVASALGLQAPDSDPTYYHSNTTAGNSGISAYRLPLPSIATLNVGILAITGSNVSLSQAKQLAAVFGAKGANTYVIAETYQSGVNKTYLTSDATGFDGVIVTDGTERLFSADAMSPLWPTGRPTQIVRDAFAYGKPVGAIGTGSQGFANSGLNVTSVATPGVFLAPSLMGSLANFTQEFEQGLKQFKFFDRFPMD